MKNKEKKYKLMAYGIEKVGINKPSQGIISKGNFELSFEDFHTNKRFNEFDGIILFQGIFEQYKFRNNMYGKSLEHTYDQNELDKRKKELEILFKKGGFICFILHKPFIDSHTHARHTYDLRETDLCKYRLNIPSFYRNDSLRRVTNIRSLRDEFNKFLELYGAASSSFSNHNNSVELRRIAEVNNSIVGMILFDREFYVPSLVPEKTDEFTIEYFSLLCESLTSSYNKLRKEIPLWLSEFSFKKEDDLIQRKESLEEEMNNIEDNLEKFKKFKKVLINNGEILVENVANLMKLGFGFKVNEVDVYKEDLKIINNNNEPLVLIEVKGTNGNVKREYINQSDSHRERAGLDSSFPSLLVINTHIKNSASIQDKDKTIPEEQVKHALKMRILIVRTLDLLFLLENFNNKKITKQQVVDLLLNNAGWLKVGQEGWEIIQ